MKGRFLPGLALLMLYTAVGTVAAAPVIESTGNDSYLTLGSPAGLQLEENAPFTLEAWLWLRSVKSRDSLFAKAVSRSKSTSSYIFGCADDGDIAAYTGSKWRKPSPAVKFPIGEWHHLAYSFDGTTITFFLDGDPIGSAAFNYTDNPDHQIFISGYNNASDCDGYISEVRLWDHARTRSEIAANLYCSLTGTTEGLLGYWPLNEGEGVVAHDLVEGNDATLQSNATWADDNGQRIPPLLLVNQFNNNPFHTASAQVTLAHLNPPQAATAWQFTFADDATLLDANGWNSIAQPLPAEILFPQPDANTTLTLYAWFKDESDNLLPEPLAGSIIYMHPSSSGIELAGKDLTVTSNKDDEPAVIYPAMVDDGSSATLGIYSMTLECSADETPAADVVTITAPGTYECTLTLFDEAGNSAATNLILTVLSSFTHWIGAVDKNWSNAANWSDGLPAANVGAIFGAQAEGFEINALSGSAVYADYLLFKADLAQPFVFNTGSSACYIYLSPSDHAILIEEGAPEIDIKLHSSRTFSFNRSGSSWIKSYSHNLSKIWRLGGYGASAVGKLYFDGTGPIEVKDFVNLSGLVTVCETFTGTLLLNGSVANHSDFIINGGTVILDGTKDCPAYGSRLFTVNQATLSGNGRIGIPNGKYDLNVAFNSGAIVDPGRPGETGSLTFENFDVRFNAGSTLRLDLANGDDYDQLRFDRTGAEEEVHVVPTLHLESEDEGVTLELNLLEGFSARSGQTFELLSGFEAVAGTFAGLDDGALIQAGDFRFVLAYEEHAVTLRVVPGATLFMIR